MQRAIRLAVVHVTCVCGPALTYGGAGAVDPRDGACTVVLGGALPGGGALTIHLRTREGKLTQAWATTGADNLAHEVDISGLKLDGSAFAGDVLVGMDHVLHRYSLKPGAFQGACGLSDVAALGGSVAGEVRSRTDPAAPVRFDLRIGYALPGMTGAIAEARVVTTLAGGACRDAAIESTTGRKPGPHWSGKVDRLDVSYDGRRLRATIAANIDPTSFLWSGGGAYVIALEAEQVGNFLHGTSTTSKAGKHVRDGVVSGSVVPADGGRLDPAVRCLVLTLDKAVDGSEEVALYLQQQDGALGGIAVAPKSPGMGRAHGLDASALKLEGDKLAGTVRLTIAPNCWGRGERRPLGAELRLDAVIRDGAVSGAYTGRYVAPAVKGPVAARWEPWQAVAARNAFAAGRDFPCWRGPFGSGSCTPSGRELVESLADMRLLWRSEADLPNAWLWGADPIGGIVGGFCTPLFLDGRVYVFYYVPSGTYVVEGMPHAKGRDKRRWREKYRVDADDVFVCIDAPTGRTLWKRVFKEKGINFNKTAGAGPFMTPCISDGRLYGIGSAGRVYCVDAATGGVVWESSVGPAAEDAEAERRRCREALKMPNMNCDFCAAPAVIDGVVCCNDNRKGLIGLDAATGRKLWGPIADCTTKTSSPVQWTHKGKHYAIVAADGAICVEPRTGRVCWKAEDAGGHGTVAVTEDYMVCAGGKKRAPDGTRVETGLSAYRIDPSGAEPVWDLGRGYSNHVTSPVIYNGHVYGFAGQATICVELKTGKIVGQAAFPGTRTCSSLLAFDGRILRENLHRQIFYHNADPADFKRLGPVWIAPSHAENTTSTVADGRLFMRGMNCLYCYDLRKPAK